MYFLPEVKFGFYNGWIPLAVFFLTFLLFLLTSPKEIVKKLYDRSGWSKKQIIILALFKIIILSFFILIIFMPLKFNTIYFYIGLPIYLIGYFCFFMALFNYRNTPVDQVVKKGIYKISRNPQAFFIFITFLGICFMLGNILYLLFIFFLFISLHVRILTEEKSCLSQYGDSYRDYMKRAPRYFLFF